MKFKLDKSYIIILLLFLFAGILSWNLYFKVYRQEDTVNIHRFPREIGGWTSEDLPLTQKEKDILETDNVFVRRYQNPEGREAYLFVIYSQNNRKVSHPPEICYTGGGAEILDSKHDSILLTDQDLEIKTNQLIVEKGGTKQVLFYWFKVGNSFTPNYWAQQGLIALKTFLRQPASSALIRISVTVHDNDLAKAAQQIKAFGQLIIPHLYTYLP